MGVDKNILALYDKQRIPIIEYIRKRGYVSFSSLKNLRDGTMKTYTANINFDIGTEVHSRWMEKTKTKTRWNADHEKNINAMVNALNEDKISSGLLKGAAVEVEFDKIINGVRVFGYIDILPKIKLIGDLKTTALISGDAFIKQMDFLQAALYLKAMNREDFYYIGISKITHAVFPYRVSKYPDRMMAANKELITLLNYVKEKI